VRWSPPCAMPRARTAAHRRPAEPAPHGGSRRASRAHVGPCPRMPRRPACPPWSAAWTWSRPYWAVHTVLPALVSGGGVGRLGGGEHGLSARPHAAAPAASRAVNAALSARPGRWAGRVGPGLPARSRPSRAQRGPVRPVSDAESAVLGGPHDPARPAPGPETTVPGGAHGAVRLGVGRPGRCRPLCPARSGPVPGGAHDPARSRHAATRVTTTAHGPRGRGRGVSCSAVPRGGAAGSTSGPSSGP
jgi:hypothetical protein